MQGLSAFSFWASSVYRIKSRLWSALANPHKKNGGTGFQRVRHRLEAGATKFKKHRGDPRVRPFFYQSKTPKFNSYNWH
jgi:hypothetical protein